MINAIIRRTPSVLFFVAGVLLALSCYVSAVEKSLTVAAAPLGFTLVIAVVGTLLLRYSRRGETAVRAEIEAMAYRRN